MVPFFSIFSMFIGFPSSTSDLSLFYLAAALDFQQIRIAACSGSLSGQAASSAFCKKSSRDTENIVFPHFPQGRFSLK